MPAEFCPMVWYPYSPCPNIGSPDCQPFSLASQPPVLPPSAIFYCTPRQFRRKPCGPSGIHLQSHRQEDSQLLALQGGFPEPTVCPTRRTRRHNLGGAMDPVSSTTPDRWPSVASPQDADPADASARRHQSAFKRQTPDTP